MSAVPDHSLGDVVDTGAASLHCPPLASGRPPAVGRRDARRRPPRVRHECFDRLDKFFLSTTCLCWHPSQQTLFHLVGHFFFSQLAVAVFIERREELRRIASTAPASPPQPPLRRLRSCVCQARAPRPPAVVPPVSDQARAPLAPMSAIPPGRKFFLHRGSLWQYRARVLDSLSPRPVPRRSPSSARSTCRS